MISGKTWFELEGAELGQEVVSIANALETEQGSRRANYIRDLSSYENQGITELASWAYARGGFVDGFEELRYNVGRSLCDTLVSQICGQQRPRPMFMTSGGDWSTRRRAKKLDKFVEAGLHQRQGQYRTFWELAAECFLDSLVWGTGAIYIYADDNRVCAERVYPWELLCDPVEAQYGQPQSLFRVTYWSKQKLRRTFVTDDLDEDERLRIEAAIEDSKTMRLDAYGAGARVAEQVRMVEAWHLKDGDEPGLHCYAISGGLLHSEEYDRDEYPIVFLRGSPERIGGWHGMGLIAEVRGLIAETNHTIAHISEQVRVNSSSSIIVSEGSVPSEDLDTNEVGKVIHVTAGAAFPPTVELAMPYHPGELEWLQFLIQACHEQPGISAQSATARKEQGVTAAVAIRLVSSLGTVRQAMKAQRYEQSFVDVGRHWVYATAQAAKAGKVQAHWPGKRFLETINWRDVDLDEDQYIIQVAPVSSLPNDPAGRQAMVQELFQAQVISAETFRRLLGWPDLERELARDTAQYEYVESLIERYLDADEDTWDPLKDYEPPEGYLIDKESAIIQCLQAYFEARMDRAPAFNVEIMRRYIDGLDELMSRGAAPPAGAQGMPPAALPAAAAVPTALPTAALTAA